jgi:CRISPR system Cascade subunit CasE
MACEGDPRVLFRIEDTADGTQVIVQSHLEPHWDKAFANLAVLSGPPEHKLFEPHLQSNRLYRFRLLANPTAKKTTEREGKLSKARVGLFREEDQRAWLARKLEAAGACPVEYRPVSRSSQYSKKNPAKDSQVQTHWAVLFEGVLKVMDPEKLSAAIESGIGSAKGFGFGLLSLAPA